MKTWTLRRKIALAALVVALVAMAFSVTPTAFAAQGGATPQPTPTRQVQRDAIVQFGDPVRVGVDERVQTVVSVGGDVTVAGTVTQTIVAVGGDVTLRPTASVGESTKADAASVVIVNGTLTREPGSQLKGNVERVEVGNVGDAIDWLSRSHASPSFNAIGSFVGWLVGTVIFLLLGLLAVAVMPGQIRAVERQIATRPGASLGWGALNFFIIVPVSLVVLAITIVGLLVVIPGLLALLFFTFFVVTTVGTFVVERLLGARLKGTLMLAVAIAIVATSVVVRIPVLGFFLWLAMTLIGTGAAVLAWNAWRLERKQARNGGAPAGGPAAGTPPYGPPPVSPPYPGQPPYAAQPYGSPPPAATTQGGYAPQGPYPPQGPFPPQGPYPTQGAQPPYAQPPNAPQGYAPPYYGWPVYAAQPQGQPSEGWPTQAQPPQGWPAPATPEAVTEVSQTAPIVEEDAVAESEADEEPIGEEE